VIISLKEIPQCLVDKIGIILATIAAKTRLISKLILLVFQHLVTQHLGKIASYAHQLNLAYLPLPLVLIRKNSKIFNELEQIIFSINEMQLLLIKDREKCQISGTGKKLPLENEYRGAKFRYYQPVTTHALI
jgi:hypothetical protein